MPFGGLLTVGIITGATQLGGAAMQSRAAARAAKAMAAKGNLVGQSIDKATGQAINAGYAGMGQANEALDTAMGTGNDLLKGVYDTNLGYLSPYQQAGGESLAQLRELLGPGGELMRDFTGEDMEKYDPGYQFRLQQAAQALQRSAAARGGVMGGGAMKALSRYSQGIASEEFQNAFNRFQSNRGAKYNMLTGMAGFGERANNAAIGAGQWYGTNANANIQNWGNAKSNVAMQGNQWIGNTGLQGSIAAGNAYTGAGNAEGAGAIAQGNAWSGALNNIGNTAQSLYLWNLLNQQPQQPQTPVGPGGYGPPAGR